MPTKLQFCQGLKKDSKGANTTKAENEYNEIFFNSRRLSAISKSVLPRILFQIHNDVGIRHCKIRIKTTLDPPCECGTDNVAVSYTSDLASLM